MLTYFVYAPLSIFGTHCYQTKPAAFKANLGIEKSSHTNFGDALKVSYKKIVTPAQAGVQLETT